MVEMLQVDNTEFSNGAEVVALCDRATRSDKTSPISEQTKLVLEGRVGSAGHHFVAQDGELVVGYAFLEAEPDTLTAELVVDPEHRGRGVGQALLRELIAQSEGKTLGIWNHGDGRVAGYLGEKFGFTRTRVMLQMALNLDEVPDDQSAVLPDGFDVRTFVPADQDAIVALNARAFSSHPEQGSLTPEDFNARRSESWFDPAGLFLVFNGSSLTGFHWTKIQDSVEGLGKGPVGEVYVVGVDPDWHGQGLGKYLTWCGVKYFRDLSLSWAMLYVEADNVAAVKVYRGLGFSTFLEHVTYSVELNA